MSKDYGYLLKDLKRSEARAKPKINPDQKLSLCMIVRNEEEYLEDCLKSVQDLVDEIIIVDTGSTDKTVEIAKKYGAKTFFMEWEDDFAKARNESLKYATGDWVLILDADERVPNEHKDNLRSLLIPTDQPISYLIYIKNYMFEQDESTVLGHYIARLFKKTPETRFFGAVHEQLYPNWGEVTIPENTFYLKHLGYGKMDTKEKKIEGRNLPLIRKALEESKGKNPSLYSFYAYYMGSSVIETKEIKHWMRESIDSCPDMIKATHIPIVFIDHMRANYYTHEFDEGIQIAEEALEKVPAMNNYPDFWDMYGTVLLAAKETERAIEAFERSLDLVRNQTEDTIFFVTHSDRVGGWGTLMNLGLAHALKQDSAKSKRYFEDALEAYPSKDKSKLVNRIDKIMGSPELTQAYFEELVKQNESQNVYDIKVLSNAYLKQENPFQALVLQNEMHGIDKTILAAFELAEIYERNQRLDLAHKTFEGVLSLDSSNLKARMGLRAMDILSATMAAQKEQLSNEGEGELSVPIPDAHELKLFKQDCQSAGNWKDFGIFCLRFRLLDEAEIAFNTMADLSEEKYDAQLYLALVAQEKQELEQAAEILQNLMNSESERPEAYTQFGNLLLFLGQFQDAETVFGKLVALEKADWYSHYALGVAMSGQERFDEAEAELREARKMSPGQMAPINMLMLIAQTKENAVEATTQA